MSNEYRAKVFKSGNSVALRLPKGVGLAEGDDVTIVTHADGSCSFWRDSDAAMVLDSLYGAFSPGFMTGRRGDTDQDERDWDGASHGKAA